MRANLYYGFLVLLIGSLYLTACDNTTSTKFEDSFELYTGLEAIEGADNSTFVIRKGRDLKSDGFFQIDVSNIADNGIIEKGVYSAWCIEWKKPLRSNNEEHQGVKLYSTNGNSKWKPLNYFFAIKRDLSIEDPLLTHREYQAIIWSLAGKIGVAPEFDVNKLKNSDLPGRLLTDGEPNFSKEKVTSIVNRIMSEYSTAKYRLVNTNFDFVIAQTEEDQQDVIIPPVEDPGKDVVVFNDVNIFFEIAMANSNNVRLVENLVNFTTDGTRNSGNTVWFDCGRSSAFNACLSSDMNTMKSTIENTMTLDFINSTSGSLTSIPSEVKVLFLWLPKVPYTVDEINAMKLFASEGGRIIFIGEHEAYYRADGIALENQFLTNMGAVLRNTGSFYECINDIQPGYQLLPSTSIFEHPITNGVNELLYACFSNIEPGPNDFVLMVGQNTDLTMAGVAEIDPEPITELLKELPISSDNKQKETNSSEVKTYGWDN